MKPKQKAETKMDKIKKRIVKYFHNREIDEMMDKLKEINLCPNLKKSN